MDRFSTMSFKVQTGVSSVRIVCRILRPCTRMELEHAIHSLLAVLCDIFDPTTINADGTTTEGSGFTTCSGHGVCARILPYSIERGPFTFEVEETVMENATTWLMGCQCDQGWTGEYCEGLDPDSYSASVRTVASGTLLSLVFILTLRLSKEATDF